MRPLARLLRLVVGAAILAVLSLAHAPGRRGCVVSALATRLSDGRLKDRRTAPDDQSIDRAVTLDRLLAPGDDAGRFDPSRGAEIEAWVVDVKVGGWEGQNCFALDADGRDTHFDLAATPTAPDTARVIAEVTPWWRDEVRKRGGDWSTAGLRRALVGRRVRVRGWLLYDAHHAREAMHVDPADTLGRRNWRATAWEIHPATAITVVP
jgi:hypothetical protein